MLRSGSPRRVLRSAYMPFLSRRSLWTNSKPKLLLVFMKSYTIICWFINQATHNWDFQINFVGFVIWLDTGQMEDCRITVFFWHLKWFKIQTQLLNRFIWDAFLNTPYCIISIVEYIFSWSLHIYLRTLYINDICYQMLYNIFIIVVIGLQSWVIGSICYKTWGH